MTATAVHKEEVSPTMRLFMEISEGSLSYNSRKPFLQVLDMVSGCDEPCTEHEARALYCARLYNELPEVARRQAEKNKKPGLSAVLRDMEAGLICYDEFFDGQAERLLPTHVGVETKAGAAHFYCAKDDIEACVMRHVAGSAPRDKLSMIADALKAQRDFTLELDGVKITGGPVFRDRQHTGRFSGKGKPDDSKRAQALGAIEDLVRKNPNIAGHRRIVDDLRADGLITGTETPEELDAKIMAYILDFTRNERKKEEKNANA